MEKNVLSSVNKTFAVIEETAKKGKIGARDIHESLDISITAAQRILTTLHELGYAGKDEVSNKYFLTYKFASLGHTVMAQNSVVELVHPVITELCNKCKHTVHFMEQVDQDTRYIDKVLPVERVILTGSYIGMRIPMYCTAGGKSILADFHKQKVIDAWEHGEHKQYTNKTITSFEVLEQELEEVRNKGFAMDNEEREMGLTCIGACIHDYKGEPTYAMSMSAATSLMTGERFEENVRLLKEYKERIENLISN